MQRKLMQLSATSKGISLPVRWTSRWNLDKGAALDIQDNAGVLEVRPTQFRPQPRTAEMDAHKLGKLSRRIFDTLVLRGYDEITIHYKTEADLEPIRKTLVYTATMFELVSKSEGIARFKAFAEPSEDELETLMQRLMHLLSEQVTAFERHIRAPTQQTKQYVLELEQTNNKLTVTCLRIINRGAVSEHATRLYNIVWLLEKVSDDLKHASSLVCMNNQTVSYVESILKNLRETSELWFSYDVGVAARLYSQQDTLIEMGNELLQGEGPAEDRSIIHLVLSLHERSVSLLGLFYTHPASL